MLGTLFSVLTIIIAILLVGSVVIQNSKGGGLNTAFGVSNISAMIGNRKVAQGIERITWWLGGLLMALAFLTTISTTRVGISKSKLSEALSAQTAAVPTNQAPGLAPSLPTKGEK